jgi:hypothetical protein
MLRFNQTAEQALAEVLTETADVPPGTARLVAAPIVAVLSALALDNHNRVGSGLSAEAAYPQAVKAAEQGFSLLRDGLGSAGLA